MTNDYKYFFISFFKITMALEEISLSGRYNAKSAADANGFLNAVTRFDFIVSLVVANKVLGCLKSLSTNLQGREVDIVGAFQMVDNVHNTLRDVSFNLKHVTMIC